MGSTASSEPGYDCTTGYGGYQKQIYLTNEEVKLLLRLRPGYPNGPPPIISGP